jgi:tRNA A-37 threonylcarbamoyl transferase component Bud32
VSVSADIRIGTELAGYRLEALLGRGGMSVVYRAEHLRLKRKVALKLLAPELAEDEHFRERFLRETEIAASLDHPNVVPVYDAGEVDALLFIAMRCVEGSDLRVLLRQTGALNPGHALALVAQVGDALDVAHQRGLVHRDVKPSNVLLTGPAGKEHCYLADFGLTKRVSDGAGPTDSGQMVGTVDYVAPEQIQGGRIDGRADVYSLSCLLYQCLTGGVPFKREGDIAVIYAHLSDAPPGVSERRPGLPSELDPVLATGMAKLRDERWSTCGALVDAARAALGEPADAAPVHMAVRIRRPWLLIAAAAGAAGLTTLAFALFHGGGATVARAASLVRIDPSGARVTAGVEVPGHPGAVTTCAGSVFVASLDGTVSEIDPRTSKPYPIHVGGTPGDISHVGALATVVIGPPNNTVTVIDAAYAGISDVIALPGAPSASATVTAYGRDVWIANPGAHELERVEPPYTGIAESIPLPSRAMNERPAGGYADIAAGEGALWVAGNDADHTLWRVNPATRRVMTIRLPFAPDGVAAGYGAVWVVDGRGNSVVRVDPVTRRVGPRIPVGRNPTAVAIGAGSVWVANELGGSVSRVNPRRNAVENTIGVGTGPIDLAVGLGAVWVVRRAG